ncbi:MAG: PilZ domain-containing protein [Candidatus Omnitrophica bacterium]|nr:PilZ domain-containing protein [Candidatus Omnitrophota bacterium]
MPDERIENAEAAACNLSASGLMFETKYFIPVGSVLEMSFKAGSAGEITSCLAKVIRVEKNLPRNFFIAANFLDMSGEDRVKINDYCSGNSSEKE